METKYSKIPLTNFSIFSKKYRDISTISRLFYMFLFANPNTIMAGVYHLGNTVKSGLTHEDVSESIVELTNRGLVVYDAENDVIAIPEMIKMNQPIGSKQITGTINHLKNIDTFEYWNLVKKYMVSIEYSIDVINYIENIDKKEMGFFDTLSDTPCDTLSNTLSNTVYDTSNKGIKELSNKGIKELSNKKETDRVYVPNKKDALYYLEYLNIWNEFLDNIEFDLKTLTPLQFKNTVGSIKKYEKNGLTQDGYKQALLDSPQHAYLFGDNKDNWCMTMSFLMREDKVASMYEGVYKGLLQRKSEQSFESKLYDGETGGKDLWDYADENGTVDLRDIGLDLNLEVDSGNIN